MPKKKKINPCRVPLTQAHIDRVKKQVYMDALRDAMTIFFTALLDKEGMNAGDLQRINTECEDISQSIKDGYVNLADLRHVLKIEYAISFVK